MKKITIAIILIFTTYIFASNLFHDTKSNDTNTTLTNSPPQIVQYVIGDTAKGAFDAYDFVAKKWGINTKTILVGCIVTDETRAKEKYYEKQNKIAYAYYSEKFGNNWREKFNKEVKDTQKFIRFIGFYKMKKTVTLEHTHGGKLYPDIEYFELRAYDGKLTYFEWIKTELNKEKVSLRKGKYIKKIVGNTLFIEDGKDGTYIKTILTNYGGDYIIREGYAESLVRESYFSHTSLDWLNRNKSSDTLGYKEIMTKKFEPTKGYIGKSYAKKLSKIYKNKIFKYDFSDKNLLKKLYGL